MPLVRAPGKINCFHATRIFQIIHLIYSGASGASGNPFLMLVFTDIANFSSHAPDKREQVVTISQHVAQEVLDVSEPLPITMLWLRKNKQHLELHE